MLRVFVIARRWWPRAARLIRRSKEFRPAVAEGPGPVSEPSMARCAAGRAAGGFRLHPERPTSALVAHHLEAKCL